MLIAGGVSLVVWSACEGQREGVERLLPQGAWRMATLEYIRLGVSNGMSVT